jgi:subtilisin family serine protease
VIRRAVRALLAAGSVAALTIGVVVPPASAAPSDDRERFIVTVVDGVDSRDVAADHRRGGAEIDFVYSIALNGFAGAMSEAQLGELQRDRRVTRIERDGIARAHATQDNATWGLDRIDARSGLSGTFSYTETGAGVHAYIIDTGIRSTHSEFTGRLGTGFTAISDGGGTEDCNGHGTHVAGTVGGMVYGVAKSVTLHPVRVLDCGGSGTWSGVIAGIEHVAKSHTKPAVANMSLGGGASDSVDDAVRNAFGAGVTMVVAAGNGNQGGKEQDACGYSPARVDEAVTIGATTQSDAKTSWSNYGNCLDLFAPGYQITSAWHTDDEPTKTISGTSMAAPHVAGVAALELERAPEATPQAVRDAIYADSTKGIVTSSKTANNHLLYSPFETGPVSENGTLSGTVTTTDISNNTSAVAGAAVSVSTTSTITGTDGSYTLGLAPDTYEVTVTASGYDSAKATVTITSAGTTTQNFSLTKSSTSTEPAASIDLSLSAGSKVKGMTSVTSRWTDSDAEYTGTYDVFVNGAIHKQAFAGTSETTDWRGGGTLTYHVCRSGTEICSAQDSITI